MIRYNIIFKGRVQGVGFRYQALKIAKSLNLSGNIRNMSNGNVECNVQGKKRDIDFFIDSLKNQRFIRVDSLVKNEVDKVNDEDSFEIIY